MSIRNIKLTVGSKIVDYAKTWSYPEDDGNIYKLPTYDLIVEGSDDAGNLQKKTYEVFRFGVSRPNKKTAARIVGLADKQTHTIKAWLPDYTVHSANSPEKGAWQVYDSFLIHDGPDEPKNELYASIGCVEICHGPEGFVSFNTFLINLSGSKKSSRGEKLKEMGSSGKMAITYLKAARPPLVVWT